MLGTLIKSLEDHQKDPKFIQGMANIFYKFDYVQDMNDELIKICDKTLPEKWKEVNSQFRQAKASFQKAQDAVTRTWLVTGLLLWALICLGVGAFFFLNQQNRPRTVVPNVVAPRKARRERCIGIAN